ncbi:protein-glutamate O-methyltransferase CheR [Candidatus Deferrimicrobium sp.]|uniref:CheR family methyltransferase n=1 Tax=Candidatus Deferrimicrobium sp. TaxID=3060586 RepID=UPI0027216ACE|nr:CheR family methyltransferase [Candidatus Deferrimicrobium sp.]MDO8737458.1 CheR family methyltransferase [Candidatus Deferrimicrobium sp.]
MTPVRARAAIPPELLNMLRNLVEAESGVVLNDAKLSHLAAVVRGRMENLGIDEGSDYLAFVSEGEGAAAERRDLVSELLVGETSFFRTPALFQAFEKAILPGLLEPGFVSPLPIWCAGCATGEEAYSVAIAALEGSRGRHAAPVWVRATDLHPRFIDAAREGIYPAQALRNLPGRIKETWFTSMKDGRYRVTDAVRRLVDFEERNLIDFLSDPLPSARYAAIFCRNVMIYFRSDTTRRLVERFHESLFDGGVLFLGHSETLWGISEVFRLEEREKIFYYRKPRASICPHRPAAAPRSSGSSAPRRGIPRAEPPPPPPPVADSSPAMKLVLSAERLADEGRLEDAVAMCRQAAALDPGCPEAEYLMAFLLRGHGRHAEALYHAERALERDPRFIFAEMEAAECLHGMGRSGEATLRWKGILRAIEGNVHLPHLSVGAGTSPEMLRQYVLSRLPR